MISKGPHVPDPYKTPTWGRGQSRGWSPHDTTGPSDNRPPTRYGLRPGPFVLGVMVVALLALAAWWLATHASLIPTPPAASPTEVRALSVTGGAS